MKLRTLLQRQQGNLALVVGNGVNRYGRHANVNSWENLLGELAARYLPGSPAQIPPGIALTEFFDLLALAVQPSVATGKLQQEFCARMSSWQPQAPHRAIINWARHHGAPLLTTNFDANLARAGDLRLHRTRVTGFTDFYPWESHFADVGLTDPCAGFAVWHINGTQQYRRSVSLGLTHYMGLVTRARQLIHAGRDHGLYRADPARWRGAGTWLHVLFHKPLLIFGLALEENEVFLRWLLIERARYYGRFPERAQPAWYLHRGGEESAGKRFFLQHVGIEAVSVDNHDELYAPTIWALPSRR